MTNEDLQAIASLMQPIHTRLDNMDTRFDSMETRLDKIESEVSALKAGQREFNKEVWGQSTENRTWHEESQKAISYGRMVIVHSSLPRGVFMRILHEESQAVILTALTLCAKTLPLRFVCISYCEWSEQ